MTCSVAMITLEEQKKCVELYEMYLACAKELRCAENEEYESKRKDIRNECRKYVEKIQGFRLTMGYSIIFEKIIGLDKYYDDMEKRNLKKEFEKSTKELSEDIITIENYIEELNGYLKKFNK